MHVTLNGEPAYCLSVPGSGLEFALCELTYYHQWRKISAALKNNQVSTYKSWDLVPDVWGNTTTVPDGYYNVCELSEDVFQPLGAELNLNLHTPTGRLQLSTKKRLVLKWRAGQNPWVFSRQIRTWQNVHRRWATQTCCLSGDLCAPRWGELFRLPA